ncbi:uncharacterized protein LOC142612256 [Castanea sativa]|uniref:uncharacterized protein LOC142612256 n=1 Tax=Castanea sativa TaxID=21020 RepID=UPI003F653CA9
MDSQGLKTPRTVSKDRLEEYLAMQPPQNPPPTSYRDRWHPPPVGFVKINVGRVVFSNENTVGVGTVIRNQDGFILASQARKINHAYSPIVLKALVALDGLQLAMELGFTHAVLEGDCLQLISAL